MLVRRYRLDKNVEFLGSISRNRLPEYYSQADIFVLPSVYEPFGIVILEAMAARLPVVASNVGGIPEIVKNNKTGLLMPSKEPKALASAIEALVDDAHLRKIMGAAGRRRVERYFTWERIAKKTLEIYENALENQ